MPFDGNNLETNSPIITLLRESRGRIEQGWVRGRLQERTPKGLSYCALGAIIDDWCWSGHPTIVENKAIRYVCLGMDQDLIESCGEVSPYVRQVADWNNSHAKGEVLGAFDKAIELAVADTLVTA